MLYFKTPANAAIVNKREIPDPEIEKLSFSALKYPNLHRGINQYNFSSRGNPRYFWIHLVLNTFICNRSFWRKNVGLAELSGKAYSKFLFDSSNLFILLRTRQCFILKSKFGSHHFSDTLDLFCQ